CFRRLRKVVFTNAHFERPPPGCAGVPCPVTVPAMQQIISFLQEAPWWQAVLLLLAENLVILALALGLGHWLVLRYPRRRGWAAAPALDRQELAAATSCVLLNTAVTLAGLALWRAGTICFRSDVGVWAWLDVAALLLIMDLAMCVLHRLGHHPWLFPLL